MQGTVSEFDPQTRAGAVLLDDGTEVRFSSAAFIAGGLRFLRLGQRLRLERDAHGNVVRVTLPTMS
jgi:2-phospho-L-lactate guanylyltransferase